MIKKYIEKMYINNMSDIKIYAKDKEFKKIISKLDQEKYIKVTSNLIHKEKEINQIEQFIFNLDNYITFIKQNIFINQTELKYIISLTIYNKYNKILYSDLYYYDNVDLYIKEYKKMFMHNYIRNAKILNKEIKNFKELCTMINNNKKRIYCYFDEINNNNILLYKTLFNNF